MNAFCSHVPAKLFTKTRACIFDSRLLSGIGILSVVIEAGSFMRAGEALGLTQSAISRVVARLESNH